ncbi:MAG TPA: hypothetical protein VK973_05915 [Arenicellales bacterium]|nr:hypothetical protein [Arenicellales bacterium]
MSGIVFALGTLGIGGLLFLAIEYALPAYLRRRQPRQRSLRVVAQFDEPFAFITRSYIVQRTGAIDNGAIEEIRRLLQRREQAQKPPLILSVLELEQ